MLIFWRAPSMREISLCFAGVKMLNDIDGNPVEFSFIDVARRARFGPPAWFGNTPAKDRKRIDRERDDAVYTLHSAA